ncbi:MAG TPA: hypothetical protein VGR76_17910 [Candidatus Angelobacter sp.]|nr:hypothetical protein [Candidatus Angelobacter sp.]
MISKITTSQIRGEHHAGNLLDSRDSRFIMEVLDENGAHCDHFLRAANRSDNSWRRRQKTSESGSHQGSRLL